MNFSHLFTCLLLIPAGLVGIGTGLREVLMSVDGLPGLLTILNELSQRLQPWAEGLACFGFGLALLSVAAILGVRGLQS